MGKFEVNILFFVGAIGLFIFLVDHVNLKRCGINPGAGLSPKSLELIKEIPMLILGDVWALGRREVILMRRR
jgi:hypothetical protein